MKHIITIWNFPLLALLALGSCSATSQEETSPPSKAPQTSHEPGDGSASLGNDEPLAAQSDEEITEAISARFARDSEQNLESVAVSTLAGVVTLTGNVSTPGARNAAVYIVDDTPGVMDVVNDLEIDNDYDDE